MREFLYSEIAVHYQLRNVPDDIDRAVESGRQLCERLLDPLQDAFGRVHIRSGYRSRLVNAQGVGKHKCASDNDGAHTWDHVSSSGHGFGAMACVSVPRISEKILSGKADVSTVAWWIYDHLPDWSVIEFFSTPPDIAFADEVAFNIGWHEKPMRIVTNWRGGQRNLLNALPDQASRKQSWSGLLG